MSKIAYKRQRNKCTNLFRKTKRDYYGNINPCSVSDNKTFWKTVKPFFSDKPIATDNITIVDNNEIIEDDAKIAESFGEYFVNAVKDLCVKVDTDFISDTGQNDNAVLYAIETNKNNPSIIKIKGGWTQASAPPLARRSPPRNLPPEAIFVFAWCPYKA